MAFMIGLIVYSVPLGWLYARTRSIVPVALMHGTIALFLQGQPNQALTHPELYWIELALWIFIGWYLFRTYPLKKGARLSPSDQRELEIPPRGIVGRSMQDN